MSCPHHKLRPGLPPLTARIKTLPISANGYPIPFFVAEVDGKPDFRIIDPHKTLKVVREDLCWICGGKLGVHRCFVGGPMMILNECGMEGPCHQECAFFSVQACPHMTVPDIQRREGGMPENAMMDPTSIKENPHVFAIYTTRKHRFFVQENGPLWLFGPLEELTWWKEGRAATRAEVIAGFEMNYPKVLINQQTDAQREHLRTRREATYKLFPQV